jgi:anaerobic C4-dicarboxylate transporter DcuB
MATMFWTQFFLVLGAILLGIRKGGVALGLIGGLGVAVLVFLFRVAPSEPPVAVMLIILAVVTASATLQVAGGLDYLVQIAERLLRAHPTYVTVIAPLCTFFLTMCVGTGHAVYALLPVISDAAAVTTFLGYSAKMGTPVTIYDILKITIPAGIVGVLAASLWSLKRGKDLYADPEFLKRMEDPAFREQLDVKVTTLDKQLPKTAKLSVALFFSGVLFIVLLALRDTAANAGWALPNILPLVNGKAIPMTTVVQIVMLAFGAVILFATKVSAKDIAKSSVFSAGMIAVVSIFGIAWMSDTFVSANKALLVSKIGDLVQFAPWTFALAMFAVSALVKSQAATLTVMIPFGMALKLPATLMLGLLPASYAYFFFAFYPSDIAAMNMDRTGTTRIGRYLLNHSFMLPGLIGVSTSTVVAYGLSKLAF